MVANRIVSLNRFLQQFKYTESLSTVLISQVRSAKILLKSIVSPYIRVKVESEKYTAPY